jgi:subtilisin-like proprotein convertase family protein
MKTRFPLFAALLLSALAANAALLSWTSSLGQPASIPDGAPTGWSDSVSLSGIEGEIVDVNVRFTTVDGYNGDLYVYLAYNGQTSVLLNRPGRSDSSAFGYGDAGLNVTFNDQAPADIHSYRQVSGYSINSGAQWQPDARASNPLYSMASDSRTKYLSSFNGASGNGSWTLFVADMSGGGATHVSSWGLDIETASVVPEPVNVALVVFAVGAVTVALFRRLTLRRERGADQAHEPR